MRMILILALAPAIGLGIGRFGYTLVLPDMRDTLGWSYSTAGFMNTINAIGYLAGALGAPVAVGELASEGGAWGIAVLASYLAHSDSADLGTYLEEQGFAAASLTTVAPEPADVVGFATYLTRYRAGLAIEAAAVDSL